MWQGIHHLACIINSGWNNSYIKLHIMLNGFRMSLISTHAVWPIMAMTADSFSLMVCSHTPRSSSWKPAGPATLLSSYSLLILPVDSAAVYWLLQPSETHLSSTTWWFWDWEWWSEGFKGIFYFWHQHAWWLNVHNRSAWRKFSSCPLDKQLMDVDNIHHAPACCRRPSHFLQPPNTLCQQPCSLTR